MEYEEFTIVRVNGWRISLMPYSRRWQRAFALLGVRVTFDGLIRRALLIIAIVVVPISSFAGEPSPFVGEDAAEAYASYTNTGEVGNKQWGDPCFLNVGQPMERLTESQCLPKAGAKHTVILWGDSSLAMYAGDLNASFARAGYSMGQLTASGCPPVIGFQSADRPMCQAINERFMKLIALSRPTLVIMSNECCYNETLTAGGLLKTIEFLRNNGSRVVFLGGHPQFGVDAKLLMADRARKMDPRATITVGENARLQQIVQVESQVKNIIDSVPAGGPSVRYVSIVSTVCPNQTCVLAADGIPYYMDEVHVSPLGSREHVQRFFSLLLR